MKWLWVMLVMAACPPAPTGTRCAQHGDCRFMPEGYCSRAELCTRVCDEAACPDGYRCSTEGTRKVCLPACGEGQPCFEGFDCQDRGEGSVCRLSTSAALKQLPAQ